MERMWPLKYAPLEPPLPIANDAIDGTVPDVSVRAVAAFALAAKSFAL
jgi:hypothetical protein